MASFHASTKRSFLRSFRRIGAYPPLAARGGLQWPPAPDGTGRLISDKTRQRCLGALSFPTFYFLSGHVPGPRLPGSLHHPCFMSVSTCDNVTKRVRNGHGPEKNNFLTRFFAVACRVLLSQSRFSPSIKPSSFQPSTRSVACEGSCEYIRNRLGQNVRTERTTFLFTGRHPRVLLLV